MKKHGNPAGCLVCLLCKNTAGFAYVVMLHRATACFIASNRFIASAHSVLDPRIREDDGMGVSGAGGHCHGVGILKLP